MLTQEDVDDIKLYRQDHSIPETARRFGIHARRVMALTGPVRKRGEHVKRPLRPFMSTVDPELLSNIPAYFQFHSMEDSARHFGMCVGRMRKIVYALGIDRGKGGHRIWSKETIDQIINMSRQRLSRTAIGKALGMNKATVGQLQKKYAPDFYRPGVPSGENHHAWKGGRQITDEGYVLVIIPRSHPFYEAMRPKVGPAYVLEHRLVIAEREGRPLLPTETVHHINGNRRDNDPANLQLRTQHHGPGIVHECLNCGSQNVVAIPIADPEPASKPPRD
jgi:hypothetical protein